MTTHLTEPQTGLPPDFGAAARTEAACKVYGTEQTEVRALDDITVDFQARRFTAIMGPSGSGKSTLLHCIAGLENMTLPLRLAGRKPDPAWIDRVVETMGLQQRLQHHPTEMSGGQQQRVAVARALATQPQIIFADEPTGNLDSKAGSEVLSFMRSAVDDMGQTIVMVTHDPTAASYADRIVFLADGRIVDEMEHPTAARVLERMKLFGE